MQQDMPVSDALETLDGGYEVFNTPQAAPVKAWIKGVTLDDKAKAQVLNVARMPFVYQWVALMPDAHWGLGATVGSVIPTLGAVIPAAVGVDLGCGMMAVQTSLKARDLPDDLKPLRNAIEKAVPHGRTHNGRAGDRGAWHEIPSRQLAAWEDLAPGLSRIIEKHPKVGSQNPNSLNHLGTLGTGNHFIEICLDETDTVWVMLHSGSRGIGNRIGSYFIELAKTDMRQWFINLPDEDLAYLPEGTQHFEDYVEAVEWAQHFAMANRQLMMEAILKTLENFPGIPPFLTPGQAVNCHHNYVAREHHYGQNVIVTRKGAVRARKGDWGIIPGSMGAKSFIVKGLGHPESFNSCSHGAGRVMSRAQAKRLVSLKEHEAATQGIECRKDAEVIDETPAAYKPIDRVMAAQKDLVEIVHTLRQVLCVKG